MVHLEKSFVGEIHSTKNIWSNWKKQIWTCFPQYNVGFWMCLCLQVLNCSAETFMKIAREELTTWIGADSAWIGSAWWQKAFMRWLGFEDIITDFASVKARSNSYSIMLFRVNFLSVIIKYLWVYLMFIFYFNLQSSHILTVFNWSARWCKARVRRGSLLCVCFVTTCDTSRKFCGR
jgi:hypothetical protein